jgi:hypothetical protein
MNYEGKARAGRFNDTPHCRSPAHWGWKNAGKLHHSHYTPSTVFVRPFDPAYPMANNMLTSAFTGSGCILKVPALNDEPIVYN